VVLGFVALAMAWSILTGVQVNVARRSGQSTYVIAAAGDVACRPDDPDYNAGVGKGGDCRQQATSDLLVAHRLDAVLALGDLQYDKGELSNFKRVYDPTWGRVRSITRPVPGNHEYKTPEAAGYYQYFGSLAGPRDKRFHSFDLGNWHISLAGPRGGKGFYSFDLGNWHIIGLNSECYFQAHCEQEQERWLRSDLVANTKRCQIAYWHRPRFTSGRHGGAEAKKLRSLWEIVYENRVEVVLNGHDHNYERFTPMDASGKRDPDGVRQFVVGTGGNSFRRGFAKALPTSEVRDTSGTSGVLFITLKANSYDWRMQPIAGEDFTDIGSGSCH
jgi:hypothetical protein